MIFLFHSFSKLNVLDRSWIYLRSCIMNEFLEVTNISPQKWGCPIPIKLSILLQISPWHIFCKRTFVMWTQSDYYRSIDCTFPPCTLLLLLPFVKCQMVSPLEQTHVLCCVIYTLPCTQIISAESIIAWVHCPNRINHHKTQDRSHPPHMKVVKS